MLSLALPGNPQLAAHEEAQKQAYELILGDGGKVFDLGLGERTTFATVTAATPSVNRVWRRGGWWSAAFLTSRSTTKVGTRTSRTSPRCAASCRNSTRAFPRCWRTCPSRGLLSSTVIWCCGEFGRTPKVQWEPPWDGGRGHYCRVFSVLVAGGGFKGGHVVGSSDAKGEAVRDRPVYPCDLLGSIYKLLGIDAGVALPHPQGLAAHIVPAADEHAPSGGLLQEIM